MVKSEAGFELSDLEYPFYLVQKMAKIREQNSIWRLLEAGEVKSEAGFELRDLEYPFVDLSIVENGLYQRAASRPKNFKSPAFLRQLSNWSQNYTNR